MMKAAGEQYAHVLAHTQRYLQMGKMRDAPAARNRFAGCRNLDVNLETSHPTASSGPDTARLRPIAKWKSTEIKTHSSKYYFWIALQNNIPNWRREIPFDKIAHVAVLDAKNTGNASENHAKEGDYSENVQATWHETFCMRTTIP